MRITKRTLVYLSDKTEVWAAPVEHGCTYIEMLSLYSFKQIDGMLSVQVFPKALLIHQLKKMFEETATPFLEACVVGRKGHKQALANAQPQHLFSKLLLEDIRAAKRKGQLR